MKRFDTSNQLYRVTYDCGCTIFVTMDMANNPPRHVHKPKPVTSKPKKRAAK